jgi:uncharacterized protein GlcG (DUF336 family)
MAINLSIAVLDEAGKMVAFARMGSIRGGFGEKLAIAKARTAVGFRRTTQKSLDRYAGLPELKSKRVEIENRWRTLS